MNYFSQGQLYGHVNQVHYPIITNEAITEVVSNELGISEATLKGVSLYPNPVEDLLFIESLVLSEVLYPLTTSISFDIGTGFIK